MKGWKKMKDPKDEKRAPGENKESFAYHEGIGDPDREWEKNMEIEDESDQKDSDEKKKINDGPDILGDEENTNHVVEGHERFIEDEDPLRAEKPFDLDRKLRDVDKW